MAHGAGALALLAAAGIDEGTDVGLGLLTGDPLTAAETYVAHTGRATLPPYLGFVSNLGCTLWCAAAAVSALTAMVLHKRRRQRLGGGTDVKFFAHAAALGALLLVDDLFMLHDGILPAVLSVPELVTLSAIGLVASAHLIHWRTRILRTEWLPLALALASFALAIGIDLWPGGNSVSAVATEAAKLNGIIGWTLYHVRCAWRVL
ncbi:MAG: hypothetical protein KDC38_04360 [Planctomycetes bacterium]|nr:hypothetical protein [Planctomycetota bacterium]